MIDRCSSMLTHNDCNYIGCCHGKETEGGAPQENLYVIVGVFVAVSVLENRRILSVIVIQ